MSKKILLPFGTLLIASPLAFAISCSNNDQQNDVDYVIKYINPSEKSLNLKTAAELSTILEEGDFNDSTISAMGVDIKLPTNLKGVTLKYEIDMPKYKTFKVDKNGVETDVIECLFNVKVYAIKKDHVTKMRGFTLTSSDRVLATDEKTFNDLIVSRIANHYKQVSNFGAVNGDIHSSLASFELIKVVTFTDPSQNNGVWPETNVRLTMEVIDMLGLTNKWMPKKIESTSVWYSLSKAADKLNFGIHIVRPNADVQSLNYSIVKGE